MVASREETLQMFMSALSALKLLTMGSLIARESQLFYKTVRERKSRSGPVVDDVGA